MPHLFEDEAEVVADGAHDGVYLVCETSLEEVPAPVAIFLVVSDDRPNRRSPASAPS